MRRITDREWELHRQALDACINLKQLLQQRGSLLARGEDLPPALRREIQEAWDALQGTMPELLARDAGEAP